MNIYYTPCFMILTKLKVPFGILTTSSTILTITKSAYCHLKNMARTKGFHVHVFIVSSRLL